MSYNARNARASGARDVSVTGAPKRGPWRCVGGRRALERVAVGLLVAALVAQALPPMLMNSGVCDEQGAHIPSGYMYWRTGVFSGGINNPPLMQLLVAAPLALTGMDYTPFSDDGLWAARIPVLALSIALAAAVFAWARSLYGRASALAALFLLCFEPNVIAHSALATLDMGVTVFLFLAFFALWKAAHDARSVWWMLACLSMVSALLTKFTAALVLPVFLALLIAARWKAVPRVAREDGPGTRPGSASPVRRGEVQGGEARLETGAKRRSEAAGRNAASRRLARCAFAAVFMSAVMVVMSHALYHLPLGWGGGCSPLVAGSARVGGSTQDVGAAAGPFGKMGSARAEDSGPVGGSSQASGEGTKDPSGSAARGAALERAARYLLPDLFVDGMLGKLRHSSGGHFAYLAGRRSLHGWWYYFPAAIALKTPIPFTIALLVSLAACAGLKGRRVDAAFLLPPPTLYLVAMAWTEVDIGVRHVLLFYPFAAVAASALLRRGLPRRRWALLALVAGAAWHAGGTLRVGPHYLAYFNEIAGGPRGGPRYLIDSNIDWGQDDRLLEEFVAERGEEVLVNPGPFSPSVGTIAVNVNSLKGIFRGDDSAYRWLSPFQPSRTLGYTWYIYELETGDYVRAAEESPADPDRKVWLAAALRKTGRTEEALALIHEVAGDFPRRRGNVLYTSGRWLLDDGRYPEAKAAFEAAVRAGAGAGAREAAEAASIEVSRGAGEANAAQIRTLAEFYAGENLMDRAHRAIDEGIRHAPGDAALRLTGALLSARDGDFAGAERQARAVVKMDPGLDRARRLLTWAVRMEAGAGAADRYVVEMERGRHDLRFGRPAAAARRFWTAFALDPLSQEALAAMGEIIVRAKLGVLKLETPWSARWSPEAGRAAHVEIGPDSGGGL